MSRPIIWVRSYCLFETLLREGVDIYDFKNHKEIIEYASPVILHLQSKILLLQLSITIYCLFHCIHLFNLLMQLIEEMSIAICYSFFSIVYETHHI